jgi:ABC-type nickel/cobalt efflux system permease component RcnA
MTDAVFTTIIVTGFTVAFLHAAIPTHWLPFVLTARVQKWSRSKTLLITALAGSGHVLFTAILGFLVAWCGIVLSNKIGSWFPMIAGGALLTFGLYYVIQQLRGKGHGHSHAFGAHSHGSRDHSHSHPHTPVESEHGSHDGILVDAGDFIVEVTIFETGVPPRFRLFFYDRLKQSRSAPRADAIKLETVRPEGTRHKFAFRAEGQYLDSTTNIPEPHEFKAIIEHSHGDHAHTYELQFEEHDHEHGMQEYETEKEFTPPPRRSDWAAIVSLLALLTFSPCEGFLPVYVSGARYGWSGFVLLTLILSVATVAGMVVFTWLTLAGMEKLKLQFLEKYESGVLGGLLCMLGLLIMIFEK